jgi:hypothetical protein
MPERLLATDSLSWIHLQALG